MTPPDSKEDRVSDGCAPVVTVCNGWEERGQSGSQQAGLMTCGWEGGGAYRKQGGRRGLQEADGEENRVLAEGQLGAEWLIRVRVTEERGDSRHGYRGTHRTVPYTPVSMGTGEQLRGYLASCPQEIPYCPNAK